MKYPETLARFYDIFYKQIRTIDHDFYLKEISQAKGPVLEAGVGTGRFFVEALSAGANVYGLDVSETMVNVLKKRLKPEDHHRIFLQDATNMSINKKFKLIIAPFRMFSHLAEVDQQLEFLNRIHDHLEEGGKFIFDLFVPDLEMIRTGTQNKMDFDGEYEPGKKLQRFFSLVPDVIRQTNHVTFRIIWDEDGKENQVDWKFDMRYFFRYEIEHLIARSKLRLEKICGDFKGGELTNESRDFVVLCRKS
jgi:SAM-dependent methyltransferase